MTRWPNRVDWAFIKRRRSELGISRDELAKTIGVHTTTYANLEREQPTAPALRITRLFAIADKLAVSVTALFAETPPAEHDDRDAANARRLGAALSFLGRALRRLSRSPTL